MRPLLLMSGVIFGLMLAESRVSARHDRQLRARGAEPVPCDPYLAIAILYPLAFLLMIGEGLWRASATEASQVAPDAPSWFASGVLMFVAGKAIKYWAIRALGDRWTFRVMVLPGAPLVHTGPYRYVAHPNYVGVIGELVGTAMMMGALIAGPIGIGLFGIALWIRIRCEDHALASAWQPRDRSATS